MAAWSGPQRRPRRRPSSCIRSRRQRPRGHELRQAWSPPPTKSRISSSAVEAIAGPRRGEASSSAAAGEELGRGDDHQQSRRGRRQPGREPQAQPWQRSRPRLAGRRRRQRSVERGDQAAGARVRCRKAIDLAGRVFGRLQVIARVASADRAPGRPRWRCRCTCGNERIVRASYLLAGRTQSCGCLRAERARASIALARAQRQKRDPRAVAVRARRRPGRRRRARHRARGPVSDRVFTKGHRGSELQQLYFFDPKSWTSS